MVLDQFLIISTLTFIQGHLDLKHQHNCSIVSETVQAIPIMFAVRIIRLKFYITVCVFQSDDLLFTQGHNCVSNLTHVNVVLQ